MRISIRNPPKTLQLEEVSIWANFEVFARLHVKEKEKKKRANVWWEFSKFPTNFSNFYADHYQGPVQRVIPHAVPFWPVIAMYSC